MFMAVIFKKHTEAICLKKDALHKGILSAVLLALGIVLPLLTGQIKEIGDSLLPMHLPVLFCGMLCGCGYGATVGAVLPFLRAIIFSMPPLYPNAIWMALELMTYGLTAGIFYKLLKKRGIVGIYVSLIGAMLCGRVVWGISKAILLGLSGKAFGIGAFVAGAFIDSALGIIIQLLIIPPIVKITKKDCRKF